MDFENGFCCCWVGFEVYLVGGCVRDVMMKRTPKDFDILTTAELREVICSSFLLGSFGCICVYISPLFDCQVASHCVENLFVHVGFFCPILGLNRQMLWEENLLFVLWKEGTMSIECFYYYEGSSLQKLLIYGNLSFFFIFIKKIVVISN